MQRLRTTSIALLSVAVVLATLIAAAPASADTFSSWTPGPGAVLDNTYDGYIDIPKMNATVPNGGFTVAGWFVDKTAQGWAGADDVQIWLGTMDGGGKLLTKALFAQSRPDVGAATGNPYWSASGFGGNVPVGSLAVGSQVLSVYAHTPGKGWWYKQTQVNVSTSAPAATSPGAIAPGPVVSGGALPILVFQLPKEGENVPTKSDYEITGYALDRNAAPNQGVAGTGVNRVEIYLGKEREEGGTFLGEAELGFSNDTAAGLYGSQFASAGWRLRFKPTQFKANTYLLFGYVRSVVTGKEDFVTRFFAIKES
jgi:hypothetical protein